MNMHGQDMLWFNLRKYKIHPKCKSYHVKGLYHVNVDLFILNKNKSQSANTAYKLQILITSCKYSLQAANNDMIRGCKWWSQAANSNHRLQIAITGLQTSIYKVQIFITGLQMLVCNPAKNVYSLFAGQSICCKWILIAASLLQACCKLAACLQQTRKNVCSPPFFLLGTVFGYYESL